MTTTPLEPGPMGLNPWYDKWVALHDRVNQLSSKVSAAGSWATVQPGFCLHRTGGSGPATAGGPSTAIHQPGSIEAAELCIAAGMTFLDIDIRRDSGGRFWVMHDADLNLTTDQTGTVLGSATQALAETKILASKTTGGAYPDRRLVSLDEFLRRFAGRVPILAEPKEQAAGAEWQLTVDLLVAQFSRYFGSVIFTVSATNVDTCGPYAKSKGLPWGFYCQNANVNDATVRADAIANGAVNVMLTTSATQETVDAYRQAGMILVGYGTSRRASISTYQALGVGLIMDEHAFHLAGAGGTSLKQPPWSVQKQKVWSPVVPATGHLRPILLPGGGLRFNAPVSGRQWCLDSGFEPLPTVPFTLLMQIGMVGAPNSSNWLGFNLCNQTDASFTDNGGVDPTGYTCYLFPGAGSVGSGLRIATREASTFTTRAQGSIGAVVAPDTDYWLKVVVTASSVTLTRVDSSGAVVGSAAVYNDSRWRGGFLHIGGPTADLVFDVKDVTITTP